MEKLTEARENNIKIENALLEQSERLISSISHKVGTIMSEGLIINTNVLLNCSVPAEALLGHKIGDLKVN